MEQRGRVRIQSTCTPQVEIAFPIRERILDPKTRNEVIALLGRLLLEASQRGNEHEVRDDAP